MLVAEVSKQIVFDVEHCSVCFTSCLC